jgi:hypothetical protein
MPQNVDLGGSYGIVAFPDDYTPEQIVAEYDSLEANRLRLAHRARIQTVRQADINASQQESRIPESIALGVDAGLAGAPLAVGHVIGAIVPTRADIEASGQRAPEGFTDEVARPGAFGNPLAGLGFNVPTIRYLGKQLVDYGARRRTYSRADAGVRWN